MSSVRFQQSPISLGDRKDYSYDEHIVFPMSNVGTQTGQAVEDDGDEEDSPYEEVRASVSNTDDPTMPVNTFRMWAVGLLLTVLGAGMNTFFIFRNPYRLVVSYAVLHFYNLRWGIGFNICLALSTQVTGFGYAGIFRRLLVKPASLIWPQNLVISTLLNTLHAEEDFVRYFGGGISRYRWFLWVGCGAAVWHWFPAYLFQGLSYFSFICWITPNNLIVNQLFGTKRGLGMSILTFDWAQVSWIGSPLMIPWWAEVHIFLGWFFFWWILQPALYYTNTFYMAYMPIGDTNTYDRFGKPYNISRILTPQITLNVTAYEEYSDLYLSPPYISSYLLIFSLSTCIITHTILYHGKTVWNSFRHVDPEEEDIHAKLMKRYAEVPSWWYWAVIVGFFVVATASVQAWPTKVPVYALMLSVALPAIYMLPGGLIFAVTGQPLSLNVLAQMIPGVLLPGNPIANMVFKCYSIETLYSAQQFSQDLKLGHYIKVPPRITFSVQLIASCLSIFTQVAVKEWLFSVVPDMCSPTQKDKLTCPRHRVYFNASAIWGLVGPSRMFGPGAQYNVFMWAFFAGALAPFPLWYYQRRYPNTRLKYVNLPVLLNGPQSAPPATGINYVSFFIVGFIFPIDGAANPTSLLKAPPEGFAPSSAQRLAGR
ncbi:hypothetical protein FRC17_000757 [Serendipita sp. 399]|nr:hypothetical protein FRC17_000757 [Serendipita sp. 399]